MDTITETSESSKPLIKKIELAFGVPEPDVTERLKGEKEWVIKQAAGKVHLIPPDRDKFQMLALNTNDEELCSVFNEAAIEVTRNWNGFHQVGSGAKEGLTAWELWKKPDISEEELLKQTKETMLQIANEG